MFFVDYPRLLGGAPALDFVNTIDPRYGERATDYIASPGALAAWARYAGIGAFQVSQEGWTRAVELREGLDAILRARARGEAPKRSQLRHLKAICLDVFAASELVASADGIQWRPARGASTDSFRLVILKSAFAILESPVGLKECSGVDCGWLFLDATKNHSRRWCSMEGCGAKAKMRRYRAAKAASAR